MRTLVLGLIVLAMLATTAWAHGGIPRGPANEVPPNMRKPEDPPPPSDEPTPTPEEPPPDGGTTTPGSDGPGTGRPGSLTPPDNGDGSGPGSARPKAPGAGSNGSGVATGGPRRPSAERATTFDMWSFWWGYNRADIVNLKARLKSSEARAGTHGGKLNVGGRHERGGRATQHVTDSKIRKVVIPALERVLDDPKAFYDMRAAAVIALGKIGASQPDLAPRFARTLVDIMNNKSVNEHFSVEESGALALGLLQLKDDENVILDALCDKALDRRGSTKNQRTRAFACLALGLLQVNENDGSAIYARVTDTLRTIVKDPAEPLDDLPVSALMAMGLSGDIAYAPDLLAMVKTGRAYRSKKLKDLVQSYAASALGKLATSNSAIASPETVSVLRKAMISAGPHTVRSAVIAFGQIGGQEGLDASILGPMVGSLEYIVKKGETQASNFALMSLARIGAATEHSRLRNRIFDTLRTSMKKGTYTGKPFAALALGVMGRSNKLHASRKAFSDAVRFEFDEFRGDAKNRGAYALALGMLGDKDAVPGMVRILGDRSAVPSLRGSCAIALGMIRHWSAAKAIKSALAEPEDRDLRMDTAVAAGLLGDSESIAILIDILGDRKSSLFVQGSVSLALGNLGDHRAIDPLVRMLENEKVQNLNRALAAVALGLLADRRDLPVMSRIAKDVNYRAQINSMEEVLTIL